jgi:hypothetical protein
MSCRVKQVFIHKVVAIYESKERKSESVFAFIILQIVVDDRGENGK